MPNPKNNRNFALPDWKVLLDVIGREGIVRNIPFILYCAFLTVCYISINNWAEHTIRDINFLAKDLKELRWKHIDLQTQIMFMAKESQLAVHAEKLGLETTKVPPYKINITPQTPTGHE
ncbi:MAG: hypothetical protein FGM54_01845 [Chitinophagaceae bacterium]|nr:hypothetical protein [Chitinophagaceae bacterium]